MGPPALPDEEEEEAAAAAAAAAAVVRARISRSRDRVYSSTPTLNEPTPQSRHLDSKLVGLRCVSEHTLPPGGGGRAG
jgi:hypothetical protein